jgi:hypothetical protein
MWNLCRDQAGPAPKKKIKKKKKKKKNPGQKKPQITYKNNQKTEAGAPAAHINGGGHL